ncbi:hypothetical protein N7519_004716 [Penicillium mononematosum]|uniref:uncharacterized protein n=1 Tax=Penicillium mononematosum TaxID=268346 RepID=UPI0025474BDF|nr:uncharacterized protein N7519_004716 [Penicillium mononematosum]KAJ6189808.1 hypothetical protein N7519_004716 [Penicillium mononematosum]
MPHTLPFSVSRLKKCVATGLQCSPASISLIRQPTIEGDDHLIFLIDSKPDYIIRITKPREDGSRSYNGQEMQARDIALRRLVQDQYRARGLDERIIPCSIGTWQLSDDGDYAASLETKLQGLGLHRAPASELTVQGLRSLLSVLKCVSIEGLEEKLGVKIPLIPFPNLKLLRESAIEAWTRLVERGQVSVKDIGNQSPINGLLERKTTILEKIQHLSPEYRLALVHNDIKGEHILVCPQSGRITGILDWADAGIGNAAVDIAGLVLTVGNNIAREIAREVGYGENEILQGVLQARCECVLRLDDRLNGDDRMTPVDLLRDQLFLSLKD